MDGWKLFVVGNHQVKEKSPPRVCPRCSSDNTRFCYYNNYNMSQPRYNCKNCRRFWTHGGALKDVPIGGRARKIKRTSIDQASVSEVVSVNQQVNHHQPSLHAQETNEFLGTLGGSSSSNAVRNHFGYVPNTHGDRMPPIRTIPPMDRFDLFDGSFNQGCSGVGFNDFPLMYQARGGHVDNYNRYRMKQEDPNNQNQSFNNNMNMNHNVNTSGSRGYPGTDHIIINNNYNKCFF